MRLHAKGGRGRHVSLLVALVPWVFLAGMLQAQTDPLALRRSQSGAAVKVDADTLFFVRANLGPFTPEQRAAEINGRLLAIVKGGKSTPWWWLNRRLDQTS
jgi:hypothetical protein